MSKDIKLIALDMDGTLLNDQDEISIGNREAIKAAQVLGIHVVLSTGRSLITCGDHAKSLALNSYLVTVNGGEIWDEQGNLLERNSLGSDHVQRMHELSQQHNTSFWCVTSDQVYREEFPENASEHNWIKFGFDTEDDEARKTILEELRNNPELEVSNSSLTNIEVNATGVNKARALQRVCKELGITMEHVMAMGDSLNDIAMITEAGIGVAMGNAQDKVKEIADYVSTTNNEDGVANAIQRFVLGSK
ncbi:YcsE [Fictibacillus macauensis ZFHKF-1]|uniref:YcsE n=1 Tax=Fictibacillus macauensis ZFHKF-1 TaxID=1196324 RepID=I8AF14_9BACL|nr:Cof-type HAD-IIB family hydrolase [Fictibacillus macauensis]EIT84217.1 YcsE [Fictibacillus macauensis ZFHKF-1]